MNEDKPVPRSLLRFGTRDLLWAMVVVGLATGWWNQSRQNWAGAHFRWREIYDRGLIDQEPKQVHIEYMNGDTSEVVYPTAPN